MKIPIIIWIILAIVLIIWIVWSYLVVRNLEEPQYTVVSSNWGYEVREYEPYIVAKVEVWWTQDEALNSGFWLLAWYIFGWNKSNDSIAMTAPVSEGKTW